MLLDDWEGGQPSPKKEDGQRSPGKEDGTGRSKRVFAVVAAVVAVAVVAGAGVAVKLHSQHSPVPVATVLHTPPRTRTRTVARPGLTPPKSWRLTFDSNFSGTELDTQVWGTCYPGAQPTGCTNYANDGEEKEWYLSSQDQVSGGTLHLTAEHEPTPGFKQDGTPMEYTCRSGMVTTYPSLNFTYGFLQITAKIPFSSGLWPAFWLAASDGKWPPEVDILEHWASSPFGKVYLHPTSGPRQGGQVSMPGLASGYHTFTLSWTKTSLAWYYDGTQVWRTTTGVPQQAMYLIANLADTSTKPGTCNGSLLIKSVKLWQPSN